MGASASAAKAFFGLPRAAPHLGYKPPPLPFPFGAAPQMGGQATRRRWWLLITEAVDHNVAAAVFKVLEAIGLDMGNASPMSTQFYWLRSPTPVTVAVVSYLLVVWLWSVQIKRAGRGLKQPGRQQQDSVALRCLVIGHNLFLALLSMYLGVGILWEARRRG